jgi:hypothetical protein
MARGAADFVNELRVSDAFVLDAFDWQTSDGDARWHRRTTHRFGETGEPAGVPCRFMSVTDGAGGRIIAATIKGDLDADDAGRIAKLGLFHERADELSGRSGPAAGDGAVMQTGGAHALRH